MAHLEIERKFLIELSSTLAEKCSIKTDIVQTYLNRPDPAIQRRVRSMTSDGVTNYYYTEKKFISHAVREENERLITSDEYKELIKDADASLCPVIKTRLILDYDGQRFEIDCYPFSESLATMELELSDTEQEIRVPPFVRIIKEVTGDKDYSNARLAVSGRFPE